MARKIDPTVTKILEGFGMDAKEVLWDCHGTWCMYHRYLEQVAAEQGIVFKPPTIIENDGLNKSVAIVVVGEREERSEWSIGEASPGNNKNNYPWAMAEKRAKDRVILKLLGLHGLVYSETEMDTTTPSQTSAVADPITDDSRARADEMISEIRNMPSSAALLAWGKKNKPHIANLMEAHQYLIRDAYKNRQSELTQPSDLLAAG